jgi:hypothetical protein
MNLDTPLFQLSARQYFEVERAVYGITFAVQLGATAIGTLLVRKAYFWWRARRAAREVLPCAPAAADRPETPSAVSLDHWPSEPGFGYGNTDPAEALGVFGVPLTVLPPDALTPAGFELWMERNGYTPGERLQAFAELISRYGEGADLETGNRPPEPPPPAAAEGADPALEGELEPRE